MCLLLEPAQFVVCGFPNLLFPFFEVWRLAYRSEMLTRKFYAVHTAIVSVEQLAVLTFRAEYTELGRDGDSPVGDGLRGCQRWTRRG
jgi:hypothetical protein